jgi:hypothetical protein
MSFFKCFGTILIGPWVSSLPSATITFADDFRCRARAVFSWKACDLVFEHTISSLIYHRARLHLGRSKRLCQQILLALVWLPHAEFAATAQSLRSRSRYAFCSGSRLAGLLPSWPPLDSAILIVSKSARFSIGSSQLSGSRTGP